MGKSLLGVGPSRSSDALRVSDVWGRTPISDVSYAAKAADVGIALTKITAARTITLPPIASMISMRPFAIWDESGSLTTLLGLSIAPAGSDLIIGLGAPVSLVTPYQIIIFYPTPKTWIF